MRALRRGLGIAGLSVMLTAGFLALAEQPAQAAGLNYYVNNVVGVDNAGCGAIGTPCRSINFLHNKNTAPVVGAADIINVVTTASPYAEKVIITKAITVAGIAGPGGATPTINAAGTFAVPGSALRVQAASDIAQVTLNNLRLTGGFQNFGGGLSVWQGTVTGNNLTITGNTAANTNTNAAIGGGGVGVLGHFAFGFNPSLTLNNSFVSGNFTGTAGMATTTIPGAGIYAAGPLAVNASIVEGNVIRPSSNAGLLAAGDGGGIYFNKIVPATDNITSTINGTILRSNSAPDTGGGIAATTGAVLTVTATEVGPTGPGAGNTARAGGGIHFGGTTLTLTGSTVTKNAATGGANPQGGGIFLNTGTATASNTNITNNTAVNVGGGVLVNAASTFTATGGSLSDNTGFWGGGLVVLGRLVLNGTPGSATLTGVQVNNNTAGDGVAASSGNGGAIFNNGTLTVNGNSSFAGNRARLATGGGHTGYGGAIWNGPFLNFDTPTATLTDVAIAGGGAAGGNANIGGAIASTGRFLAAAFAENTGTSPGVLTLTGTVIGQNVAGAAGGIYLGGPATITDSSVGQNFATNASAGYGGGIWAAVSPATDPGFTVTVDSSSVNSNSGLIGAGMAIGPTVTANVVNASEVDENTGTSGAGAYVNGTLNVTDASVSGNDAAFGGGGIMADDPDGAGINYTPVVNLTNATVNGNTAGFIAGGVSVDTNATLNASGGEISNNVAVSGGGVVVGNSAPATLAGTDLLGNTANGGFGGAVFSAGTVSITNATVSGNRAVQDPNNVNTGWGGAIYSGASANGVNVQLTVAGSTFSANEARRGSVLVDSNTGNGTNKTSIDRSTLTGNLSGEYGAIVQGAPLTISNSTIVDNLAPSVTGGLVLFAAPSTSISGSIVAGNSTAGCANLSGLPVDGGYNLADPGDTSCGFSIGQNDVFAPHGLGALAANGGPTGTRMPLATSAALDVIPTNTATGVTNAVTNAAVVLCGAGAVDQRGTARPIGPRCEIGSTETDYVAPTIDGPTEATYTVGNAGTQLDYTTTGTPIPSLSVAGTLPDGVTFTDNGDGTGSITGTPTDGEGDVYVVDIVASNGVSPDASIELTLTVNEAPELSGPDAATYTVGELGGPDEFASDGHPTAALTLDGTLPDGVAFTPDDTAGTAAIGGTPTAGTGGVHNVTVNASNGIDPDASHPFQLTVNEAPGLSGPATATFTVGANGSSGTYTATGYPVPTIGATGLPNGLGVSGSNGTAVITGTPLDGAGGFYEDVPVTATNGIGSPATVLTDITVNESPEIAGAASVRFVTGTGGTVLYSTTGFPQATLSATGSLPAGISFSDNGDGTGTLEALPSVNAPGTYTITITASNGVAPDATLEVTILVVPPVTITTTSLANGSVGIAYSASVVAAGGQPPYTFSITSGSLPAGLSLDSATGAISGTPTGPVGTSTFTVQAADALDPEQTAAKQLSITIGKGPTTLTVAPVVLDVRNILGIQINVGFVAARLTIGTTNVGIPNQTIVFKAGGTTVCTTLTNATGNAHCALDAVGTLLAVLNLGVTATFTETALWQGSSGSAGLLAL